MKISIIIPTLNEQEDLPKLLRSIQKQDFKGYEVIIADAGSTDDTKKIAKKYGCRIIKGGMPAVGRNAGAQVAKGEFLYFFDADVILPDDFLANSYFELQDRFLDLATCSMKPMSDVLMDEVLHRTMNTFFKLSQYTDAPKAPGFCILVSKRLFDRVDGFDEEIKLAEDHEFVERAAAFRHLRVLFSTYIYVSVRRLEKEGRVGLSQKYLIAWPLQFWDSKIFKKDILPYDFANFQAKSDSKLENGLLKMDKFLRDMNDEIDRRVESNTLSKSVVDRLTRNYNSYGNWFNGLIQRFLKRWD